MMRSLWTAASGMRAQQVNVDTIANNIANVNTTGYKAQEASFKSLLYQNLQSTSTNNAGDLKPVAAEVGLGSRVSAITSIFDQGALLASDNVFSMAIEGEAFYSVRGEDGQIYYTRDGNFTVSPVEGGNMLVTADGLPVLDQYGNTIIIPEEYNAANLEVQPDGQLKIRAGEGNILNLIAVNENGEYLYDKYIGLYQFSNPAGLSHEGDNCYGVTPASGDPLNEFGNPNLTPSKVHQRYTEGSNVDVANEVVNLIVAQRAYEMNSKAIQASDEMMQQANNLR